MCSCWHPRVPPHSHHYLPFLTCKYGALIIFNIGCFSALTFSTLLPATTRIAIDDLGNTLPCGASFTNSAICMGPFELVVFRPSIVSLHGLSPGVVFSSVLKGGLEGGRLINWFPIRTNGPLSLILRHQVINAAQGCDVEVLELVFLGADLKENKISWFKWNKVLMSKDKGGLGVSNLFALNRALLFKWVWRFHDNRNALWSRFIRALHGNCGGLDKRSKAAHTSVWKSITTEVNSLRNKGVDLLKFMNKKVGNGIDMSFWEEIWRGDMNFKTKFARVYALEPDKKNIVASKMNHNDVGLSLRRAPRDGVELEQSNNLNVFLAGTMLSDSNDRRKVVLRGFRDSVLLFGHALEEKMKGICRDQYSGKEDTFMQFPVTTSGSEKKKLHSTDQDQQTMFLPQKQLEDDSTLADYCCYNELLFANRHGSVDI
ncbi:hypothetical protein Tco_0031514 [Tanacetum coccineum]